MFQRSILIIMMIGILSYFKPINSNLCYKNNMLEETFKYEVFDQDYSIWYDYLDYNYFYLLKNSRWFWNKYSKGNYKKPVDFKRNFHFHLRDESEFIESWDSSLFQYCVANYGIAIILGEYTYQDYKDNREEDLMFTELENSVVIAFRVTKNQIAIYNCKKEACQLNEIAAKTSYSLSKYLNLNMHIIYDAKEHKLKVYENDYSVDSNLKLEYSVNLAEGLEYGMGFLGLTTTDKHCGLYHHLSGTYLCTNGGDPISPKVFLEYQNQQFYPNETVPAVQSQPIKVHVEYSSNDEKILMGPGSLYIEDEIYGGCLVEKQYENKYIYNCYLPEDYNTYKISYKTFYESFYFNVDVQSAEIDKLVYEYGKKSCEKNSSIIINGTRYLKYGSLIGDDTCGGDFDLSEFNNDQYLTFYVKGVDKNKKGIKIRDMDKIRETLQLGCKSEILLEETDSEFIYKIGVKVNKKGVYSINSGILDLPITFYVKDLIPDINFSKCSIANLSLTAYNSDEMIKYICEFKDKENQPIKISEAINEKRVNFNTKINRLTNSISFSPDNQFYNENIFTFIYTTNYNGKYQFETQIGVDGMQVVKSTQNTFLVSPEPKSLEKASFYNFDIEKWINIDNIHNSIFNYYEDNESRGSLFLIDLVDIRDPDNTKYSEIEQSYVNFKPSSIEGIITEEHSEYKGRLEFEAVIFKGKRYILGKLISREEMRRTSYEYIVTLKLNEAVNLRINYVLYNAGDYIACRKDLNISNSLIIPTKDSIKAGFLTNIAQLILRTDLDHLYNYFLDSQDNITFNGECLNQQECVVEFSENINVYGIYDLKFKSNLAGEYNISAQIYGMNLKENEDFYTIKVDPIPEAYILEKEGEEEKYYRAGNEIKFIFTIKDYYSNLINYDLPSDNLGITCSLFINGIEQPSSYIKLDKGNSFYYIKETSLVAGEYTITLKTKYSDSEIKYNYIKGPGDVDYQKSIIKVINSNKLNLRDISIVEVYLYDTFNNYINFDSEEYKKEAKKVEIYALNKNGFRIEYYNKEENKFITDQIEMTGSFHIYAFINGNEIKTSFDFEVIDFGFDFYSSQLKMIGDKIILMSEGSYYNLYYGLQRPAFEFDFMTIDGLPSNKINREEVEIKANIFYDSENEPLKTTWIASNKLIWTLPEDLEFENGTIYTIQVANNNTIRQYYLQIVNYGEDESIYNDYNILKTYVSPNILYLKAGIAETLIVEFRGEDNLRYNGQIEKGNLSFGNIPDYLHITTKYGNKNGQLIVEIISDKIFDYSQNYTIRVVYGEELITNIQLIVNAGELSYFLIDKSCIKDQDKHILYPGTAGISQKINLIPYDKFNNEIKDSVFDSKIYPEESFSNFFNIKSSPLNKISLSTSTNPISHYIELSISSEKTGKFSLSSFYLKDDYEIEIKPGEVSKSSIGYLVGEPEDTSAGINRTFIVEPKDKNGNKITDKDIINQIIDEFTVKVFDIEGNVIVDYIKPRYNEEDLVIEYVIENEKAETKIVEAYYNDEEIIINNNVINVVSGKLFFNNTKLIYNEKEYSILDDSIQLSLSYLPIIDIKLSDEYGNEIVPTNIVDKDFILNKGENILSKTISYNSYLRLYINDSKVNDYFSIEKEDNDYNLYVKMDDQEKNIKIIFVDYPPQKEEEEPLSFTMNTDNLLLKAGEEGLISLTFYSGKGKPIGNFFDISQVIVSCEDDKNIRSEVLYGKYYGTYNIIISSETATKSSISCSINANDLEKEFTLKVIPNKVEYCKLNNDSLSDAISGETYLLSFECLDKYNNKAYLNEDQLEILVINPYQEFIEYDINIDINNVISLYFEPTYKGAYEIKSKYLKEEINFNTSAGKIAPENCYLEINEEANAGDYLNIDIHVLDKYNNEIVADESHKKIFDLYYRYKNNSKYINYQKIENEPQIVNDIIRYTQEITKDGINEFRGIYPDTSTILKCDNCEVKVISGEIDLENSEIFKYNTFSQTYSKLDKESDILYNIKEDILIKIYPKDKYGNKASASELNLTVSLDDKELEEFDSNEDYIEFRGEFSNLKNNEYDLVISNGEKNISYKVYVSGDDGFDGDVEPSNTKLLDSNLEFTAGENGYFYLELRNQHNVRYNKIFNGNIDIVPTDKTVKYQMYNKNSSTILVVVQSNKANTFPNQGESKIEISINSKKIFELELSINPDTLYSAKINPKYVNESSQLESISTDEELRFSLIGYDYLNNKVLISASEAKLLVKCNNNEIAYKSSYLDVVTGEQKYIYDIKTVGLYYITSGKNNKEEELFNGTVYSFEVTPGEISIESTIVKLEESPISAGKTASIVIYAKDKYNNEVHLNKDILDEFSGYVLSNDYNITELEKEDILDSSFKFKGKLIIIGTYEFNIMYKGKKLKCNKLIIESSKCNPNNTLIYSKDKNGEFNEFRGETNIYSSYTSPLNLYLVFKDDYQNTISNSKDLEEIQINEAYLSGNNMETLYWTYKNRELYLDLSNNKNRNIIEHLVTRIGENAYDFSFKVKNGERESQFNLKVNHYGKNEDKEEEYGNGDYDLEKCKVNTEIAEFMAGSSYEVFLTLRTQQDLIYNGEFDTKKIECSQLVPSIDNTFNCTVSPTDKKGIYSLKYYSTLVKTEETYNIIKLYDSNNNYTTFKVLILNTHGIPCKEKTIIKKNIPKIINPDRGDQLIIEFTLSDIFNNPIDSIEISKNLVFENNGKIIKSELSISNKIFSAILEVEFPPKAIRIQLYYRDNENDIELFDKEQESEFEFNMDYRNTVVNSKNAKQMQAGELLDLNIILYDKNMLCYNNEDYDYSVLHVTVQGPLEKTTDKLSYYFKRYEEIDSDCRYIYKIDINESNRYVLTGTYSIVVYIDEQNIVSYTQTVISGDIDYNNFVVYYTEMDEKEYTDQNIPAGEVINFIIEAYDHFYNKIDNKPLSINSFRIEVNPEKEGNSINYYNWGNGALSCNFLATKEGKYNFKYYYEDINIFPNCINGPKDIIYIPGACSTENPNTIYPEEEDVDVSSTYTYMIQCLDKFKNIVKTGGAKLTSKISLTVKNSQDSVDIEPKIMDNGNGSYDISFIPPLEGEYSIITYLDGKKYGENIFNLTARKCEEGYYACPNDPKKCKEKLIDCIPEDNQCQIEEQKEEKPFRCNKTSKECVDSMTKCNPEGTGKCHYMNALYPIEKGYLCSYYLPLDCKRKYPSYRELCEDGICRTNRNLQPNQRVCPLGKVLCVDLTCADSISDCYNDWPKCEGTQVRCPDQSCADDQKYCPTTITCPKPEQFVCPDGTCVSNEIYCSRLKTCPEETPYLCTDNSCATNPLNCPHTPACGHGKSLCSDLICRDSC